MKNRKAKFSSVNGKLIDVGAINPLWRTRDYIMPFIVRLYILHVLYIVPIIRIKLLFLSRKILLSKSTFAQLFFVCFWRVFFSSCRSLTRAISPYASTLQKRGRCSIKIYRLESGKTVASCIVWDERRYHQYWSMAFVPKWIGTAIWLSQGFSNRDRPLRHNYLK